MGEIFNHKDMYYGARPALLEFARQLRINETAAEKLLWEKLSKKQVNGLRFRRQHPVLYFITDFFCPKAKLIIEVDGSVHQIPPQYKYDRNRDSELTALGLTVLRFTNEEVINDITSVLEKIRQASVIVPESPL